MKTVKCEVCGADIKGDNFEAWFKTAHGHWMTSHADLMKQMEGKPKEEGEKWMAEAKKRFESA